MRKIVQCHLKCRVTDEAAMVRLDGFSATLGLKKVEEEKEEEKILGTV